MTNLASTKQLGFITSLLEERDVPQVRADLIRVMAQQEDFTSTQASNVITTLLTSPRKPKAQEEPAWERMRREEQEAFADVENSYYAVPTSGLQPLRYFSNARGDLQFFRVYTYKGRRYLRKLTGAPGDFRTTRLPHADQIAVLGLIAGHHVMFAQKFGEVFQRCGRCAAPLTDQRSRELHLGPDCRKIWKVA